MKHPTLPKGYSERGADMGRSNTITEPDASVKFHLYRMPMSSDGCYDSGGAYWGAGSLQHGFMYHAYGDGSKERQEMFVRARNREEAKEEIRAEFRKAKFWR